MKYYIADQKREEEKKNEAPLLPIAQFEKKRDQAAFFASNMVTMDADTERAKKLRAIMRKERRKHNDMKREGRNRGLAIPLLPLDQIPFEPMPAAPQQPASQPRLVLLGQSDNGVSSSKKIELRVKSRRKKSQRDTVVEVDEDVGPA